MKALILAGGFGTRLRPLSCTRPKLLFPIANRPLLDLTLQRLAECGIEEVVLAVNFMADVLERTFGKSKYGVKLHYSRDAPPEETESVSSDQKPLGTGGALKRAEDLLRMKAPFLVLNGDILTDADYLRLLEEHKKNQGLATLALHRVKDPTRYGIARLDSNGRVRKFVEKPTGHGPSNLANAGIYVIEPNVFEYIKAGRRCSIEREVFPRLAREGKLFGDEISGLWIDIGKPSDLIEANRLWLELRVETPGDYENATIGSTTVIGEAVAIEEGVVVGEKSVIGPNVSLGKDVAIGDKVSIRDSIVFPNSRISDLTRIAGAIIGDSVSIGKGVTIEEGCLIGDSSTIQDNVTIKQTVRICPQKTISDDIPASQCVM